MQEQVFGQQMEPFLTGSNALNQLFKTISSLWLSGSEIFGFSTNINYQEATETTKQTYWLQNKFKVKVIYKGLKKWM